MSDKDGASKQKLYVYMDESGIETSGRLFIVGCVVIDGDPQPAMALCEQLERQRD